MFDWVKARVLRLMRVPHEPEPPLGAAGSVRIFRAGLNHYYLRLARWAVAQSAALVGIGFSLVFLAALEEGTKQARRAISLAPVAATAPSVAEPSPSPSPIAARARSETRRRERQRVFDHVLANTPSFVLPLIKFFEFAGIALLGFQMLVTYSIVRLEFEQHWYIVTDRSLRIRTGILRLQESTMSFANVQQVEIRQGPLQRILGLSDVRVRSAGGGEPEHGKAGHGLDGSLHVGTFENVVNGVDPRPDHRAPAPVSRGRTGRSGG